MAPTLSDDVDCMENVRKIIHGHIKRMTLSALFLAIGYVLPFLTGQIQTIGNMLLPMHIPVLLCGVVCGWQYGLGVGLILPLTRSLLFGKPILYPTAVSMAFELATYGAVIGLVWLLCKRKGLGAIYTSLVSAMLAGRAVWGIAQCALIGVGENGFTVTAFISGGFVKALPGIIIQLIILPPLILLIKHKTNAMEK